MITILRWLVYQKVAVVGTPLVSGCDVVGEVFPNQGRPCPRGYLMPRGHLMTGVPVIKPSLARLYLLVWTYCNYY